MTANGSLSASVKEVRQVLCNLRLRVVNEYQQQRSAIAGTLVNDYQRMHRPEGRADTAADAQCQPDRSVSAPTLTVFPDRSALPIMTAQKRSIWVGRALTFLHATRVIILLRHGMCKNRTLPLNLHERSIFNPVSLRVDEPAALGFERGFSPDQPPSNPCECLQVAHTSNLEG